jgi:ubiquitin-conjugating enzyme E2 Z
MNSDNTNGETIVISRETTRRLLKDIRELIKNPLNEEGIYYKHHESEMLKGYAYICGPKDSVYFGGNYFYEFNFPYDYPHRPPKVTFLNLGGIDGNTRFHPNMYKNGKMCLSLLNTWKGDQWTGCQSIRTILLTIISILDNGPLLHEPGFTELSADFNPYNKIIKYKNIEYSVCYILQNKAKNLKLVKEMFEEDIKNQYKNNKTALKEVIESNIQSENGENIRTGIYNLKVELQWNKILDEFKKIKI